MLIDFKKMGCEFMVLTDPDQGPVTRPMSRVP